MAKVESLYGTTPIEIFQSGIENHERIAAITTGVLWKNGHITVGWSNVDLSNLARMILMLDERQRRLISSEALKL